MVAPIEWQLVTYYYYSSIFYYLQNIRSLNLYITN